jgi:transglutaminase-like putative cysteine protease
MYYRVQHITRFIYSAPITESVMEVRMQPRTEELQRCHSFKLTVNPSSRVSDYRDHLGNTIHNFDIPGQHRQLALTAEAIVERRAGAELPDLLSPSDWEALDHQVERGDYWDMLFQSDYTASSVLLQPFAEELGVLHRRDDPLTMLRQINSAIYERFEYAQDTTSVDSMIDEALESRQGVCQDFAHIMTALVRNLQIPCRYVSGYLFHRKNGYDRSVVDATHAWVEAYLPHLGWVGFDPTNNVLTGERHIRVAVGRDYADAPPTKGVFKGDAETELRVSVKVEQIDDLPFDERTPAPTTELLDLGDVQAQQQQQ